MTGWAGHRLPDPRSPNPLPRDAVNGGPPPQTGAGGRPEPTRSVESVVGVGLAESSIRRATPSPSSRSDGWRHARAIVSMEVLVEKDQVAPVRVLLNSRSRRKRVGHRPHSPRKMEIGTVGQVLRDLEERHLMADPVGHSIVKESP